MATAQETDFTDSVDLRLDVWRLLGTLDQTARRVLVLFHGIVDAPRSECEIAAMLRIPEPSVTSILDAAHRQLRARATFFREAA